MTSSTPTLEPRLRRESEPELEPAHIGRQIRELRRSRKVSLVELSALSGRSIGNLSEMERGRTPITIGVLQSIAEALGVSITYFFSGSVAAKPGEREIIVRKADRKRLSFEGTGMREELLSPALNSRFMLVETTFAPGGGSDEKPRYRKAEEGGVVLSGQLELTFNGLAHLLQAGDSFSLKGDSPHFCRNPGTTDAVVLWIISPPHY